ncbi:DivIVA domain-containing protein [Aeromicrobium fastidiosum]|uniref:DivIVA domain-containing protein n=1 Tax=Aeromicrobium fastidiosum TaxID=52699 RepID=A0A641AL09_9ACTN|nr:DivIVA domain-containing protein [Aeromicrobium fastidiosum]KAA1376376.1 DivIVA domain-containing protein [Aeromicrobium fastidiosum]MBP2391719.1 DivIVA domain-containing protein [Aeromicrobium fastidiosum]
MSSVSNPSFTRVRLREGYRIEDVDGFLAGVRPLLDGRLPNNELADRIESVRFAPVRLRPGYDMDEVDSHLEQLLTLASQGHPRI